MDDILAAAPDVVIDKYQLGLEEHFGPVKRHQGDFRHFGIHITQPSPNGDITKSQQEYLETLHPVTIVTRRGDGRVLDSSLNHDETHDFRSLTCGI